MSDTHIGASALASLTNEARLVTAYQTFAKIDSTMDAIVTVGDITESGTLQQFNTYKAIMDENSKAQENILSLGNHDNYQVNGQDVLKRFEDVFGFSANHDKEIGGYHFITVSTLDREYNTATYEQHREWLEARLDAAHAEDPARPIFVFIHHTMVDTCIGSRQSQADPAHDLRGVLSKYSQVVTFSGHSHVSPIDPRNIWQGDYTALNCGSVYYVALDFTNPLTAGQTNNTNIGYSPVNRGESSTGIVVDVDGSSVTIRRVDMYYGKEIAAPYVFDTSADKAMLPYRQDKRMEESRAPEFVPGAKIAVSNLADTGFTYTFAQAENKSETIPDDGAFVYTVEISESETGAVADTARLQANYFMLPQPETVSYSTNKLKENTSYRISVTPIGFYGKEGAALTGTFTTKGPLSITCDANLVKKGDYFRVAAAFVETVQSNAAILDYAFDTEKYAFRGFTPSEGMSVLNTATSESGVRIAVMMPGYGAKELGQVLFSAREDAALQNEDNEIKLTLHYVVKDEAGGKLIRVAAADTAFTSSGGTLGTGENGDVTLIDLSNVIDMFGADTAHANWSKYRFYDYNNNGAIDIQDIAAVAKMIKTR
ncbi:MAG: metallophosphoesterase [Oscillospiraceae bacterium]|jgi:predicted phosphodiesterase|nr:metallophosphoesterase [Oscillospiraceae bacterium]